MTQITAQAKKQAREIRALKELVVALAEALEQHARTDCAPDEALPFMRRLKARARRLAAK